MLYWPLFLSVDRKVALNDGSPLQASDSEGIRARFVHGHYLAVAYGELVERFAIVVPFGLRLEAHQVAVVKQNEVAVAPVADVLATLLQPALLDDAGGRTRGWRRLRHAAC